MNYLYSFAYQHTYKPLLIGGAIFFLVQALSVVLARWLGLSGWDLYLLVGGLLLLGLIAGLLIFLLMRARAKKKLPADGAANAGPDDLDLAVAAARSRLASARKGSAAKLGQLPLVLFLGPNGSTKTTAIVNSGLDPELLAGEVHRGDTVVSTGALNLWYAQDLVLVEAGGGLLQEPDRWAKLTRHLRPSRWSAALARKPQAPRAAVVCFPCDELVKPGNSEAVPAAARTLRARLAELSEHLGIRLPVYVLFTKADQIPYFQDYVRSFSREEAQQVLGSTLTVPEVAAPGTYAERESKRLGDAFRGLFQSLALRRLDVLPRENVEKVKGGAYEFPREFRKISDLATQFLVELCKPSQLGVSPFLRGFYFTGVRPVVVSDTATDAPSASLAANPASPQIALGATSVFSLQQAQQQMQQAQQAAAQSAAPGTRRVPEWVFLKRVFRDVLLQDQVARIITGGGTRVNVLRRTLIGAAAAFFLLLSVGFTVSYFNNRALERDALAAAHGVERLAYTDFEAPSMEVLQRLDALREQTARVGVLERSGRPWRLAWGLYTGSSLYPHLRHLYFDRFERLLWGETRTSLLASMRGLPESPNETSEYGTVYNTLKAHLITTSHPHESTVEFLSPVLMNYWYAGRGLEGERLELARRNFDFYAYELPFGNPYREPPSEAVVTQTRGFLHKFADSDRLYQVLLTEAGRVAEPIRFGRVFPGAEAVVRNPYEVPGAFTEAGWTAVNASLQDVDRLFARERWVIGERAVTPEDRAKLAQQLRARYVADYVRHWREFLRSASVASGGGFPEIAQRLERLSSNQPPLMQMFALVSQHTTVDTTEIVRVFQPVHQVVPPGTSERFVGDSNAAYIQSLGSLHSALAAALAQPRQTQAQALSQAGSNVQQVEGEVRNLAQRFSIEGAAREVGDRVQQLMRAPLSGLEVGITTAVTGEGAAMLNEKGESFCGQLRPVLGKYPFNPAASAQATIDDVMGAFQPGSSTLWAFHDDALTELLVRRGLGYGPRVGATPQPTAAFLEFFNRASGVSRAMFDESGAGPEVVFSLRPQTSDEIPEITVSLDGQSKTYTRTDAAFQTFVWDAARARGMRITGRINGVETLLVESPGMWGVFRVFQQAQWSQPDGNRYTVQWSLPGQQQLLTAEITFVRGVPIFHPQQVAVRCVTQLAR
jgi:type VI secretion system protein ImpL